MTFEHIWILWLLPLPALWVLWEWRRGGRRAGIVLKAAVFLFIILALARPKLAVWETKVAVAVLADVSGSIPAEQIEQQAALIGRIQAARGRNQIRLISFDDSTRRADPAGIGNSRTVAAGGSAGTNLEVALRNAMAALPAERVPRLALLSDGKENAGAVERAVYQAQVRGIPIDTIALAGRPQPQLSLRSLVMPLQAFAGERFPIETVLESPREVAASVELRAEGKSIGRSQVRLKAGPSIVRVWAQLDTPGSTLIHGTISCPLGELTFQGTTTLRRPKMLLLSSDAPESDRHLLQILSAAGYEVERSGGALPDSLELFHLVVANNQDFEHWPQAQKQRLERFVRQGGGFLLIAGEKNLYVEPEPQTEDEFRKMLAAELAPPRTPEGTAVVLVLDKSSSMEGKKMQLARQSAIGVVENLRPIDQVGVLVFDNSFQWAVPLQRNDQPEATKDLITAIIADGGTQIAPALNESFRQIQRSQAVYKHIVLLTDGISEEGDSIALAKEAVETHVTISTVGLGQDVNRSYLERVARTAEGKSYFLIDVSGLAQLVVRDVMEHTGSSVIEKPTAAKPLSQVELLEGVDVAQAGPLLGWVRFIAKPQAETLLEVDQDPLLVRWQYGLGRSAVFASDAKDRWAVNWVDWPGFDRFWTNVLRDLLPRAPSTEATARYDRASEEIIVRYRLTRREGEQPPAAWPKLYVLGPDGFRQVAPLDRVGATTYEARVSIGERYGLFRIRPESDLARFPEIAYHRANTELEEYGSDPALLRRIAERTGGRFNPEPAELFDAGNRAVETTMHLWPGLLALAILMNLIELLARKGWLPWLGRWA